MNKEDLEIGMIFFDDMLLHNHHETSRYIRIERIIKDDVLLMSIDIHCGEDSPDDYYLNPKIGFSFMSIEGFLSDVSTKKNARRLTFMPEGMPSVELKKQIDFNWDKGEWE
jgi:hypothetical protein